MSLQFQLSVAPSGHRGLSSHLCQDQTTWNWCNKPILVCGRVWCTSGMGQETLTTAVIRNVFKMYYNYCISRIIFYNVQSLCNYLIFRTWQWFQECQQPSCPNCHGACVDIPKQGNRKKKIWHSGLSVGPCKWSTGDKITNTTSVQSHHSGFIATPYGKWVSVLMSPVVDECDRLLCPSLYLCAVEGW